MNKVILKLDPSGKARIETTELDATKYADDAEAFSVIDSIGKPVLVARERQVLAQAIGELREDRERTLERTQALVALERRLRRLNAPRPYTEMEELPRRDPGWEPPKPGPILA